MITQRRYFSKSISLKQPKVVSYVEPNENNAVLNQFQLNKPQHPPIKHSLRSQLAQISNNFGEVANSSLLFSKNNQSRSSKAQRLKLIFSEKEGQIIFGKQSEYFLNENLDLSLNGIQCKMSSKILQERPKTSLSQQTNENWVSRKEMLFGGQMGEMQLNKKISASRALSRYSMVPKHSQMNRFKVKKEKQRQSSYFSARKIVFQVKQSREKDSNASFKLNISGNRRYSKKMHHPQSQEYELKGWDYD